MRYLPLRPDDRKAMLARIGVASIDDLFRDVPEAARDAHFDLPRHASEMKVERTLSYLASHNAAAGSFPFFCGAGAYRHHVPATVDHLIQRSEFLTSYTPYQPEIAQGTLQALFEFQTQVALITGMEVANASMYDGSTATAEAVLMAHRITGRSRPCCRAICTRIMRRRCAPWENSRARSWSRRHLRVSRKVSSG
jgi:glycine dehydrogenase subunit 1